jgi:hypothetical protein
MSTELKVFNKQGLITSLELMNQVNIFRNEIEGKVPLRHKNLLNIIRDEFEEEVDRLEIQPISYIDSMNREQTMFELTHKQAKQVLLKESKVVRKATIEHIEKLEQKVLESFMDSYMIDDAPARARRWAEEQEEKQAIQKELILAKPKVDRYDIITKLDWLQLNTVSIQAGLTDQKAAPILRDLGVYEGYKIMESGKLVTRNRISEEYQWLLKKNYCKRAKSGYSFVWSKGLGDEWLIKKLQEEAS